MNVVESLKPVSWYRSASWCILPAGRCWLICWLPGRMRVPSCLAGSKFAYQTGNRICIAVVGSYSGCFRLALIHTFGWQSQCLLWNVETHSCLLNSWNESHCQCVQWLSISVRFDQHTSPGLVSLLCFDTETWSQHLLLQQMCSRVNCVISLFELWNVIISSEGTAILLSPERDHAPSDNEKDTERREESDNYVLIVLGGNWLHK